MKHPWLKGVSQALEIQTHEDIYTLKERDTIYKEFLRKDPLNKIAPSENFNNLNETDPEMTEHDLDTKNSMEEGQLLNQSTKSVILAPFNSTFSCKSGNFSWSSSIKALIVPRKHLRFLPRCKDLNRQYEQNNNDELDNGVYNDAFNSNEENHLETKEEKQGFTTSLGGQSLVLDTEGGRDEEEVQVDEEAL